MPYPLSYPGAEASVARWVNEDGCAPLAVDGGQRKLTMTIPGPDTKVKSWGNCAEHTDLQLWTIQPFHSFLHFPHTPLLREEFTGAMLDFLLTRAQTSL